MPTKKKRVGFIPREDVMRIIEKLSTENNLSNSKIISILVEEALSIRGIFNKNNGIKKNTFVIAGGVAANLKIRENLTKLAKEKKFSSIFPPINLCSDNAAMIAWAGIERFRLGLTNELDFPARSRWPLDEKAPFLKGPGLKL